MGLTIVGAANFAGAIQEVKTQITTANLRAALNYAIDPAYRMAKQLAPKGSRMHKTHKGRMVAPGFLSRSITKNTKAARDKKGAAAIMKLKGEAFYGAFVAGGYRAGRRQKKSGGGSTNMGRMVAGRPFMKPAVDRNQEAMATRFNDKLTAVLKKKGLIK
jgi:hypothetical protein